MTTWWSVLWRAKNKLDGVTEHLMWRCPGRPAVFRTRREAREYIASEYGYIKTRPDLQREPHGWRVPRAVKVQVVLRRIA